MDSPSDHLSVDPEVLIQNLASCTKDGGSFRLNPEAFSATVSVPTPGVLDKALSHVGIKDWWDAFGDSADLKKALGIRKAGTRLKKHEAA